MNSDPIQDWKDQYVALSRANAEIAARGQEIERQAAEILELSNRVAFLEAKIDTREGHIAQLIAEKAEIQRELEMHRDRY